MTREQAMAVKWHDELHCTVRHKCSVTIGPRGGYSENITRCRPSGKCKVWKRDVKRFYLPVKHGLYESGAIEDYNQDAFHLASECPALLAYQVALESGIVEHGKTYW